MPSRLALLGGLVVLLATGVRPYTDDMCPNDQFIQPCTCRVTGLGLYVVCTHVQSFETLKNVFKTLSDYGLGRLLVHQLVANGQNLPADLFSGMHVAVLRFTDCDFNIVADSRPLFGGLEDSLTRLEFRSSHMDGDGIVAKSLSHLVNLKDLIVTDNRVNTVPGTWLANGPGGLDKLELDKNHIERVETGSFAGLHELLSISLKKNDLTRVDRSVLPNPARKLSEIDLSFNQLTELPDDFFTNMAQIRVVNLQGNQLATLPENIWRPVWSHLDEVYLQGNPLQCDKDLRWALKMGMPPTIEGACSSPEHLKGTDLVKVRLEDIPANRLVRQNRRRRRRMQT